MKVIGLHMMHDTTITVAVNGDIIVALEFERLFGIRYYMPPVKRKDFISVWGEALRRVNEFTGIHHFDVCVSNWVFNGQKELLKPLISADKWVNVDHHICHAASGFYDSPFNSAIVMSSDGGGNTTAFELFSATREHGLISLRKEPQVMGRTYSHVGAMLREVTGSNFIPKDDDETEYIQERSLASWYSASTYNLLSLPGKKMGYAALGKPRKEWLECMKTIYGINSYISGAIYTMCTMLGLEGEIPIPDGPIARDLAATSQYWFTKYHCDELTKCLEEYHSNPQNTAIDGIVVAGGCGLNVGMNQILVEKFGLPVHVPCASGDPGIGLGACWTIEKPTKFTQLMYMGMPLFDIDTLDDIAQQQGACKVTTSEIAALLMNHHIIGVARGRAEFGPRALGHRSLLAYPDKQEQLTRVNKLKRRQFYRPACPSVTEESAIKIFKGRKHSDRFVSHETGLDVYKRDERFCKNVHPNAEVCLYPDSNDMDNFIPKSPYMSFAPTIKEEFRDIFPAVCHFDNTARLQTVSKKSEPWFYSLLQEIGKRNGGYEMLINTSFNIKGQPILNKLSTALEILDTESELSYVVCEDWLFKPNTEN